MELMVCGSRSITEKFLKIEVFMPDGVDAVISCGEGGFNALVEKYASENGIKIRTAGVEAIDSADRVLVFWDGKSEEAKLMYDRAKERKKPVDMIVIKVW